MSIEEDLYRGDRYNSRGSLFRFRGYVAIASTSEKVEVMKSFVYMRYWLNV